MKTLFFTSAAFALTITMAASANAADVSNIALTSAAPENSLIAPAPKDASKYQIIVNGQNTNLDAVIKGSRTDLNAVMVPVREICEKLGFTVTWHKDKTVTLDNGSMHSTITIGEDAYIASTSIPGAIGTTAPFTLGAAPIIIKDSTYVPLGLFRVLLGNGEDVVTVKDNQISIQTEMPENIQIPSPLTEHTTIEALKKAVSFNFVEPTVPAGYKTNLIQDISGDLAEIRFSDGKNTIHYRVSAGSEDNSGIGYVYDSTKEITVDGSQITCKGNAGTISLAVWEKGGLSYSLFSEEGLTATQMQDIIESIL